MYIPKQAQNEANKNTLILKDETSRNILSEVCQEQNIPFDAFAKLIIWQYQNKNKTNLGINSVIDELIDNME